MSNITKEIIKAHGFSNEDYAKIKEIAGREPNITELGIFSAMWSEHCSYKSTRIHIKRLPTKANHVICGPGENAGIIDIGNGKAIAFKMESHNHPSFIEPFQGAATGVGGILRDIFTMGARPIALLNSLRFGAIDHPKTKFLLNGVVSGISHYGNCMGIPTVAGECSFHKCYNNNILVNAMCVGVVDKDKIFYSKAEEVGAEILYAGAKTGRDGINGAVMASMQFDSEIEQKRPTVQVGDPFTEKRLMEACLELMQEDAVIAIQDMGAAGLTCSSVEMADKGNTGIEINLDNVPKHDEKMTSYELMLSESQERMLIVINPEKRKVAQDIFDKWEIDSAVIGKITDSGRMVIKYHGDTEVDLPVSPLADSAPIFKRPHKKKEKPKPIEIPNEATAKELFTDLKTLLATPTLASKRKIWQQYDHKVGNATVAKMGGDAAIIRIHGTQKAIAVTSDCNFKYCKADPVEGGKQAVAETWRNLTAVGAKPLAITNCLNFANPEKEEIMGEIVGCIDGMREACEALNYPVVSGNASLYNETELSNGKTDAIFPTPTIGGVGLLENYQETVGIAFVEDKHTVIRIGNFSGYINSSLYLDEIKGEKKPTPPPHVDLESEKNTGNFIRNCIKNGWVSACHDVSEGGQLVAIAEMAMASKNKDSFIGATINIARDFHRAFGEDQGVYIVTASAENAEKILTKAPEIGVEANAIGETGGKDLILDNEKLPVADLYKINEQVLSDIIG